MKQDKYILGFRVQLIQESEIQTKATAQCQMFNLYEVQSII